MSGTIARNCGVDGVLTEQGSCRDRDVHRRAGTYGAKTHGTCIGALHIGKGAQYGGGVRPTVSGKVQRLTSAAQGAGRIYLRRYGHSGTRRTLRGSEGEKTDSGRSSSVGLLFGHVLCLNAKQGKQYQQQEHGARRGMPSLRTF